MSNRDVFFEEQREHSRIKSGLIVKYFVAWANVMVSSLRKQQRPPWIGYIDLFAGQGVYDDGSESTPLRIAREVVADPQLAEWVALIFNDKDAENIRRLGESLERIPEYANLHHRPRLFDYSIDGATPAAIQNLRSGPTLTFIDPFGYKGLSRPLLQECVRDWGCDCLFFFNYNRINAALTNAKVRELVDDLFGAEVAADLRRRIDRLSPHAREDVILDRLTASLRAAALLSHSFRIKDIEGRTQHFIVGVTKHFLGLKIIKDIMGRESSSHEHGIPSYTYDPSPERFQLKLGLTDPLEALKREVQTTYAGRALTFHDLVADHWIGRPYQEDHYRRALDELSREKTVDITGRGARGKILDKSRIVFPSAP